MKLFCKSAEGFNVKVGDIQIDTKTGQRIFIKHKPHLMRIVQGYGIQKNVFDENNNKFDMQTLFRNYPNTKIIIIDADTGTRWESVGSDWLEHQHNANYGDGKQMFLSTTYMTKQGNELYL